MPPVDRDQGVLASLAILGGSVTACAIIAWLFLARLKGEREAVLFGFAFFAAFVLFLFLLKARSRRDNPEAGPWQAPPWMPVVAFGGVFVTLVVVPILTGEPDWAGLVGSAFGLSALLGGIQVSWLMRRFAG
jgi:hypothetical protein